MNYRKHLFLLAVAVLVLIGVLHLQGCAAEYTWRRAHSVAAENHLWRKVSRDEMYQVCGQNQARFSNLGGCAYYSPKICEVWSMYSEEEAKRVMSGDGISLWEHELAHCQGFVH